MDAKLVLKNLSDYDLWEHTNYKLRKEEADVIIPLLNKAIPKPVQVVEDGDEDEDGRPYVMYVKFCPCCSQSYRFRLPNYCENCGQRLDICRE